MLWNQKWIFGFEWILLGGIERQHGTTWWSASPHDIISATPVTSSVSSTMISVSVLDLLQASAFLF